VRAADTDDRKSCRPFSFVGGTHVRKCGAETVVLEAADLEQRYPWMNVDDLVAGSIGAHVPSPHRCLVRADEARCCWLCAGESMEGSFDPWSLLTSFKKKAVELGVTYVDGLVTGLDTTSRDGVSHVNSIDVERTDGTILSMPCGIAVNACGAWSRPIAAMAGVEFPVFPRLRSLFFVHCPAATCVVHVPTCSVYCGVQCCNFGADVMLHLPSGCVVQVHLASVHN